MSATAIKIAPAEASVMPPKLELRGISKSFPGVRALSEVSFSIWPGETHMLLGENGAGKSTLMKILCGAVPADSGEIVYENRPVTIASPADARRLGIAVIFQEFSLVPHLDIAHNIYLGRAPRGRLPGSIDHKRLYADARRVLDMIGFDIDPRESVHRLGVAQQQMRDRQGALAGRAHSRDGRTNRGFVGSRKRAAVRHDGAAEGGRRRDRLYLASHG
jgi:ribose transport system ATP-binding protein